MHTNKIQNMSLMANTHMYMHGLRFDHVSKPHVGICKERTDFLWK